MLVVGYLIWLGINCLGEHPTKSDSSMVDRNHDKIGPLLGFFPASISWPSRSLRAHFVGSPGFQCSVLSLACAFGIACGLMSAETPIEGQTTTTGIEKARLMISRSTPDNLTNVDAR